MSKAPPRILFLSRYAGFAGGIERYMHATAQLLRSAGYGLDCACQEQTRDYELFAAGFDNILSLPEALQQQDQYDLLAVHKIFDRHWLEKILSCRSRGLALFVHDHDTYCPRRHYYTPFGRRNCRRKYFRVPCTACAMLTSPRHWQQGPLDQLLELGCEFPRRLDLFRQFPAVVVLSDFMRGNLLHNGFAPEQVLKLPPFVRLGKCAHTAPLHRPPQLLFVGQLIRGKGADLLLQTLARLEMDFRAVIAGDGFDRPGLEKMTAELNLQEKVHFAGWVRETEELYASSDLLLLPARWQEPFGLVGLEAAAQGLPIAAFDLGGCREYLLPGINGLLVPPGEVDELARQTSALLRDPERLLAYGQAGMNIAREKFSPELFLENFSRLRLSERGSR
ncbi:MAG: glycosyltransferase family 4 protein [Oligosphaeraceae bacterium]|nr:glycosyltransferase family 4 protein [Oligosphaeraceae bacterium]